MKRNLITTTLIGILLFGSLAAGIYSLASSDSFDGEAMAVANQLYNTGSYAEAIQVYEQLLSRGMVNSSLYYNLGNAYYIQGDLGRAILNFQRAARLNPRDPEIREYLALARTQSANEATAEPGSPIQSLAGFTSSWFTLNENALLTLGLWFLLGFLVFAFRQIQPGKIRAFTQYGLILVALIFVMMGISLGSRIYAEQSRPEAVIIADQVTLNSSPGDEFTTDFSLSSGAEVAVLDVQGSWAHLALPNDILDGWIPVNTLETVSLMGSSRKPIF
jgi:tetratricopeptide (TPR) repeat protein